MTRGPNLPDDTKPVSALQSAAITSIPTGAIDAQPHNCEIVGCSRLAYWGFWFVAPQLRRYRCAVHMTDEQRCAVVFALDEAYEQVIIKRGTETKGSE